MKCSLKDGFVSILLIIFIAPSEGVDFPLLLQTSSVMGKPMNIRQFRAAICKLHDSFPNDGESENTIHKIVKKQMAASDSGEFRKRKRSVLGFPFGEDGAIVEDFRKSKKALNNPEILKPSKYSKNSQKTDTELLEDFAKKVKNFSKQKRSIAEKSSVHDKRKAAAVTKNVKTSTPNTTETQNSATVSPLPPPEPTATPATEMKPKTDSVKKPEVSNTTETAQPTHANKEKEKGKEREKEKEKEREKEKDREKEEEEKKLKQIEKDNPNVQKKCIRIPDYKDQRYYYEFETNAYGCIKMKHKRCPEGHYFSCQRKICVKLDSKKHCRTKRHLNFAKLRRTVPFPTSPDDMDPSNEWLDASQGSKIPPEFKPSKKPELKIFHLILQKKFNEFTVKKRNAAGASDSSSAESWRHLEKDKSKAKRQEPKSRRAKSFIIHIHKKGRNDESVAETDENDEKDDEEDSDDEDEDDEEGEEEDEESDDDASDVDLTQKNPASSRETIKEFIKSAKEAVTNRARFNEEPVEPKLLQKSNLFKSKKTDVDNTFKSKKLRLSDDVQGKNKKVLIDANIKVDSAISNALKCVLKGAEKTSQDMNTNMPSDDESLISDRGSQDQLDPELIRMYEHLLRHNPRVKRYFTVNREGNRKL